MPDGIEQELDVGNLATGVLSFANLWLFAGFVFVTLARTRRASIIGRQLCVDAGDDRLARVLFALVGVAVVLGAFSSNGPALPLLLFASLLAVGTILQSPHPGEGRAGEEGITLGWEAWEWKDVQRWRLLGEHLRVDVGARWIALQVSPSEQPALETLLEQRLPERRSELK